MADKSLEDMVKAVSANPAYKVLTKEEYDLLVSLKEGASAKNKDVDQTGKKVPSNEAGSPEKCKEQGNGINTSTPDNKHVYFDGTRPKFTFQAPGISPISRLKFNNTLPQNTSFVPSSYVPKLPTFSGAEEPQKGETSYEVWSLEVKCLQNSGYLPEALLLQAIRNSLKGTARSLLVPLGQDASVSDILSKLDGFYDNVSSSETLMQSFYSDFQKETESVVSFASRLEQTLSRAVKSGHIDKVAKDAMLRSKFWTGLKSQSLKNSTRHLYDTIKDFQSLLREIRKVDQEENSLKTSKKQATQQQQSGQLATEQESTNVTLLQSMKELVERMEKMEKRLDQHSSQSSFSQQQFPHGRGRGQFQYRGSHRGGYGRGYQNFKNQQNDNSSKFSQRGNTRGSSQRGRRGGTNGRGAGRGGNAGNLNEHLNF